MLCSSAGRMIRFLLVARGQRRRTSRLPKAGAVIQNEASVNAARDEGQHLGERVKQRVGCNPPQAVEQVGNAGWRCWGETSTILYHFAHRRPPIRGRVRSVAERRWRRAGEGGTLSLNDSMASSVSMKETGGGRGSLARRRFPARPPPLRFIMRTVPPLPPFPRRTRDVARVT